MATDPASLLREHGVHVTAQRLAVLRAVSSHPHCTADEVAEHARAEIGTISRQAVYDALSILADNGLIRRIQPAGSPALYECRVGDNHHHLICRTCGKTADVDCTVGNAPCLTPADTAGYQIDEAEVIFWGKCPDCLAASQGSADDRARSPAFPIPTGKPANTQEKPHVRTGRNDVPVHRRSSQAHGRRRDDQP